MPRDANGNYTLPDPDVVAGTTITATHENDTLDDIAAELEDSLSRSGKGGMLVPFQFDDGDQNNPGITFTNENDSGIYRAGNDDVRTVIGGTVRQKWTGTGVDLIGAVGVTGVSTFTGNVAVTGTVTTTGKVTAEGFDAGTNTIDNVVDPTTDQQAATKKYVDDQITGGTGAWTQPTAGTYVNTGNLRYRTLFGGTMVVFRGWVAMTGPNSAHDTIFTITGMAPVINFTLWGTGSSSGIEFTDYFEFRPNGSDLQFACARGLTSPDILYLDGFTYQVA